MLRLETFIRKVNLMTMRKGWLILLLIAAATPAARAQVNCSSSGPNVNKLSCLVAKTVTPPGYAFSNANAAGLGNANFGNSFEFLNSDIGGELSQIPLASPASGIIFTTDPTLHVPVPSNESLGPILTQRADTIGYHKFYAAVTYQYFLFEDVDGHSLRNLPAVFSLVSPTTLATGSLTPDTIAIANSRTDLKIHQFVGYLTFGLTSRTDISIAVPVLRVDMRYTINEDYFNTSNASGALYANSQAEQATGLGDIIVAVKDNVKKFAGGGGVAIGGEFRIPSGDALNYLGSGTGGGKPFVAVTYPGRISPHFNGAIQLNGHTPLVTSSLGSYGRLPGRVLYSGGADWRVTNRLTIAADVMAQYVINGQRASILPSFSVPNSTLVIPGAVTTVTDSYNRVDGSGGFKLKVYHNLLLTGNILVKLNQPGLRQRIAPLVGGSYTF